MNAERQRIVVEQVRERVAEIADLFAGSDNEKAHIAEDNLYVDVLGEFAHGDYSEHVTELAQAVLEAQKLNYQRWYA